MLATRPAISNLFDLLYRCVLQVRGEGTRKLDACPVCCRVTNYAVAFGVHDGEA